ncbi:MAG: tyrosine-type recombinase/integrase [Actinomycetota bacterium]|nr:tyrosine-type recombinase/integrase [Actinomycetota bacterium]
MARKSRTRRPFGAIRKLPSGRFQAKYLGPDAQYYVAPVTYEFKSDAEAYLSTIQADLVRQTWKAPVSSEHTVDSYGLKWIAERPLKDTSRIRYLEDWNNHISPRIGDYQLDQVTPEVIRTWYSELGTDLADKLASKNKISTATRQDGTSTVARCYRILRAVMNTAVEDELIASSPCRIKNGGTYRNTERPTLTIAEIDKLATFVSHRYKGLVLVLAWTGIRLGEATELRRRDLDFDNGTIRIDRAAYPNPDGGYFVDTPKSRAGHRKIAIPVFLCGEIQKHLDKFVKDASPDALVFPTRTGSCAYGAAQLAITKALRAMGRSDIRVHDLRHTGQVLAAQSGATLADLMARLGHSSVNAAMKYAHAAGDHGRQVADRMEQARSTDA